MQLSWKKMNSKIFKNLLIHAVYTGIPSYIWDILAFYSIFLLDKSFLMMKGQPNDSSHCIPSISLCHLRQSILYFGSQFVHETKLGQCKQPLQETNQRLACMCRDAGIIHTFSCYILFHAPSWLLFIVKTTLEWPLLPCIHVIYCFFFTILKKLMHHAFATDFALYTVWMYEYMSQWYT